MRGSLSMLSVEFVKALFWVVGIGALVLCAGRLVMAIKTLPWLSIGRNPDDLGLDDWRMREMTTCAYLRQSERMNV